jgi:hypothetical protein
VMCSVPVISSSSLISSGDGKIQKKVKTVYVPPTEQDLEQLLIELETSEPLSTTNNNLNHGKSPIKRAQSAVIANCKLMKRNLSKRHTVSSNAAGTEFLRGRYLPLFALSGLLASRTLTLLSTSPRSCSQICLHRNRPNDSSNFAQTT